MRFPVSLRRIAVLAWMWACCHAPTSAQESQAPPTPESFLKIINEQIAAMSNMTFDLVLSQGPRITNAPVTPGEPLFDAEGNPVVAGAPGSPASTMKPTLKFKVRFANLSEHWVTRMNLEGQPHQEFISDPMKGHTRVLHYRKESITGVRNPGSYALAYSLLPLAFVERYKNLTTGKAPATLTWAVESHSSDRTTIVLRVQGKVRLRATFASPSQMCVDLRTYEEDEKELEFIESVPGAAVANLPFLASGYKRIYKGEYTSLCETEFTAPLPPGSIKPYVKPVDYLQLTDNDFQRRVESEVKARAEAEKRRRGLR